MRNSIYFILSVLVVTIFILALRTPFKTMAKSSADHPTPVPLLLKQAEYVLLREQSQATRNSEEGISLISLNRGNGQIKEVALTFDDGPHPVWTPRLLDLLKSLDVHATFFYVGKMVDRYPDLVARAVIDGHEVANHTYDHISLRHMNEHQAFDELTDGANAIKRITGYAPRFFRPPGGFLSAAATKAAEAMHITPVMWTNNSKDFAYPPAWLLEYRLLKGDMKGAILLCHDGIPTTLQVLPDVVNRLKAQGYQFVTASEMAHHLQGTVMSVRIKE